jgi:hypothetical protein
MDVQPLANPPKSGSKSKQVRFSEYAGYTECRDCEELSAHAQALGLDFLEKTHIKLRIA